MTAPTGHNRSSVARHTGLAYLGIIVTGIFAEFVVRGSLVVDDDPATTARNIADAPGLFSVGIGADVVMIALDVAVAFGLFRLLQHVDRRLARATTAFRLLQGALIAVNLLFLFQALDLSQHAVGVDGAVFAGPAQDALDAIERHALGYDIGLIAFGISCVALSHLLLASGLVSRALAMGMFATGAVYLGGSFAALFAPSASESIAPLYLIPLVVEPAFAIRLIRRLRPGLATTAPPVRATA